MDARLIGKIVSRRFRIEDVVGRGGMAIVYRAFDMKTHQTVAFKVLREEYEGDPEYQERFRREAEACRKLNHPNVVNLVSSGSVGGVSYIAMEYVDGKTLKEVINERGLLSEEEAVRYALQILSALGHAHQRGIVHRDVKPQNVFVSRMGQAKIGDFGIAGMADTKTLTTDGNVMGSVHYFSPEQAKGMKATAASDLYSVGIILYEMLTGHVPFEGETAVSVAMMHLMEPPKPVDEEVKVSRAVSLIVAKALEKQPQNRYQSADAMVRDLRRALRHPEGEFMEQRPLDEKTYEVVDRIKQKRAEPKSLAARMATLFAVLMMVALIAVAGLRLYNTMFILVKMPDLAGLDAATAERMVQNAGLELAMDYAYSAVPEGYVSEQKPAANEDMRRGDTARITVSMGSGMVTMQRLTGKTKEKALAVLDEQGLVAASVTVVPSEMLAGTIVSQNPEAGTSLQPGSEVELTVSGGRIVVPELMGQREEEASARIDAVGLTLGSVSYKTVKSASQDGMVLSQSIDKFTVVLPGSTVDMTVGRYDKRKYTADVTLHIDAPEDGMNVRVTLVEEDGQENDMYAATHMEPGDIKVKLRSETSGVHTWRLYLDGNFKREATAVLQ